MTGYETGPLLKCMGLSRKSINKIDSLGIQRSDIVFFFFSLKILCENLNLVISYDKVNLTAFVLSLWDKFRLGLNSFGQYTSIYKSMRLMIRLYA